VVKVNVFTSCDDLLNEDNATNVLPEIVTSREKKLIDQVASLKTSVDKLTREEIMHKKILFYHARDYGKRGLGSFSETAKASFHLRRSSLASSRKLAHITNIVKSPDATLGSVPCLSYLSLPYLRIHLCLRIIIFS
jgi:hypothetical protein